jgi:peptidoglycan/xylan/chitin deacetylase (PgdA/CDA1 family)
MLRGVALRRAILRAARTAGVFDIVARSRWRSQRLLILGYHGISIDDEHQWNSSLYMPQSLLRERMHALRQQGCAVLPLGKALECLYSGSLPPKAVSLTFDDGNKDFRLRALPVLEEFGYPALVYLTTYYSLNSHPVFNVLFPYLLWKCERAGIDPSAAVAHAMDEEIPSGTAPPALKARVLSWLRNRHPHCDQRHQVARVLATAAGLDYQQLLASGVMQLMNPEEVREVAAHGIRIELHTHRHRTPDTQHLFKREVQDNRECIMEFVPSQTPPVHFCYPSGIHSAELYPWLESEGILSATTCKPGLAGQSSNRLTLPRLIDTCSIAALDFEGWVSGTSHLLPRRT